MLNHTSSLNFKSSLGVYLHNIVCVTLQMQSFKQQYYQLYYLKTWKYITEKIRRCP